MAWDGRQGEAFAVGRNLNAAMESERIPAADAALTEAERLLFPSTPFVPPQRPPAVLQPKAAALVHALRQRYAPQAAAYAKQKAELDAGYAAAMRNVSTAFPTGAPPRLLLFGLENLQAVETQARWAADLNIQCLFADALMNTMPWDYYEEGRAALGRTLKPRAQEVRQVRSNASLSVLSLRNDVPNGRNEARCRRCWRGCWR